MSAVRDWLEAIGLGQYADAFEANDIDMDLLKQVDAWRAPQSPPGGSGRPLVDSGRTKRGAASPLGTCRRWCLSTA